MRERGWREEARFDLSQLTGDAEVRALVNAEPSVRWTAYVLGVIHLLKRRYPKRFTSGVAVYLE